MPNIIQKNNIMEKFGNLIISSLCLLLAGSCQNSNHTSFSNGLDNSPVVGTFVQVGDDQVLSCDQKLLTDSIRLPLSFLTEKAEIIHLDNRDEALSATVVCLFPIITY